MEIRAYKNLSRRIKNLEQISPYPSDNSDGKAARMWLLTSGWSEIESKLSLSPEDVEKLKTARHNLETAADICVEHAFSKVVLSDEYKNDSMTPESPVWVYLLWIVKNMTETDYVKARKILREKELGYPLKTPENVTKDNLKYKLVQLFDDDQLAEFEKFYDDDETMRDILDIDEIEKEYYDEDGGEEDDDFPEY